jgi:hypothetical protein
MRDNSQGVDESIRLAGGGVSVQKTRVIAKINSRNGGALNRAVLGASDEHIHRSVRSEQQRNARFSAPNLGARVLLLFGFVVRLGQIEGYALRPPPRPKAKFLLPFGNLFRQSL